ncbi:helix-turn-helix domain-containing protein [Paucilactobacillus nenjiangensis]|jgi:transcriptional regulator with XRE-family HTH domain|uniref:helix-turn-helix domain-containing protein n=1 Tax=Paucilactobacillus nenjiangensis TaxID=1296540 RepID=UPI003BAFCA89
MPNRIKELRKEKGLTLDELSEAIKIPRATISRYENGNSEPKLETWQKLADYFDVIVGYIQGVSDIKRFDIPVEIAPFMKLKTDGTVVIETHDDKEKDIKEEYENLPGFAQDAYDVFTDVWNSVDIFLKVPKYIEQSVNVYFLDLLTQQQYRDQDGKIKSSEEIKELEKKLGQSIKQRYSEEQSNISDKERKKMNEFLKKHKKKD